MPSRPEPSGDRYPRRSKTEAAKQIQSLAVQAVAIAKEAELNFLVYILGMAVDLSGEIVGNSDPQPP